MPKLNVVIADSDAIYTKRLVNYLTENNKQLNISSFTERASLIRYFRDESIHIHIILFSEDMYTEEIEKKHADLKMLLSDGSFAVNSGYKSINKYQRAEDFVNDILISYSEATGTNDMLVTEGKDLTRAIAFFSPVGGSGKTTLAITAAKALSSKNRKILYLNFEGVSSVKSVFSGTGMHTMSEVYLAAKTKKASVGLKIVQCRETHYETGIDFINPPECAAEYTEMTPKELKRIIKESKAIGQYDDIIVDMSSGYNDDVFEVLETCNMIILPYLNHRASLNKMEVFADEINKLDKLESIAKRAVLLENMSKNIHCEIFGEMNVRGCIPQNAVLSDIDNILYSDTSQTETRLTAVLL